MGKFSADVGSWVRQSEKRIKAVRNEAAQTMASEIRKPVSQGGRMKIDTGYLRASLMGSTSQMPSINPEGVPGEGQTYSAGDEIALVIAGASITDTIYMGFTAAYARPREYLDGFVRLPAQRWQQIVQETVLKLKSRAQV